MFHLAIVWSVRLPFSAYNYHVVSSNFT